MSNQYTQRLEECQEPQWVGGKAANVGRLIRAGFTVPGGFAVTTLAYRAARAARPETIPLEVTEAILAAYREMGGGTVAVRSSATAEDLAEASMAGQYETFLDIEGDQALLEAIGRCWASIRSARIRAYFEERGIDGESVAMAVVVQRLVPAEVAGVLFTSDPRQAREDSHEMLIEATWGLGETLVAGHVQPDVFRLDRISGRLLEATISEKRLELVAGKAGHAEREVEEPRRSRPCLNEKALEQLCNLGNMAVAHFGAPQDIEWALHAGKIYLLQSRPITTLHEGAAQERAIEAIAGRLAAKTGHGPWVLHNLAETLPHPTPLTWSVIGPFMSGAGGFGEMYRRAGFAPSARVNREGFLELIGGRIYMDAATAPEMFGADFPFAYDLEALKRSPDASQSPPTLPRGSFRARLRAGRMLKAVAGRLRTLAGSLDRDLRESTFPAISRYVADARAMNLRVMASKDLADFWEQCEKQVLGDFAPRLFLPSLIGGMALADLRQFLAETCWREDPDALARLLSTGGTPTCTVIADAELYEVGKGVRSIERWLRDHGHRAPNEFDLAAPRWREQPEKLREAAMRLAAADDPMQRHRRQVEAVAKKIDAIRAGLSSADRAELDRRIDIVRRYLPFREDSKEYLILGYDLLRSIALEAGHRLKLANGDPFFMTRNELCEALRSGAIPLRAIAERKAVRRTEARLQLPRVIDPGALESLGRSMPLPTGDGHKAFGISAGQARGPVRVLTSPTTAADPGAGYILVCPSTDPSWTPLFVNAAGLVLECGGTLSHGAVVAREMGLPAVVLPDATRLFHDGEELFIDGTAGWVGRAQNAAETAIDDPADTRIAASLIPPPAGRKDRRAGTLRNIAGLAWLLFVGAFFLLPAARVEQPTLNLMDHLLWPMVRIAGKPGVVVIVAAAIALITLLLQKWLTDNARLLEAKRRAAAMTKQARLLPSGSPRRAALQTLAAGVQARSLLAAMVPVGLLLGPLVLPFVWFSQRIDPAVSSPPAGTAVQVVALVDSASTEPVTLNVPEGFSIDEATPPVRTLAPLRPALEHLLALYKNSPAPDAWELQLAPDIPAQAASADLEEYLARGVPPQGITWLVHPRDRLSGRFELLVSSSGDASAAAVPINFGEQTPPVPKVVHPEHSPIREVRVTYAAAGASAPASFVQIGPLHFGWVLLYILVYVPILFAARALLKVA